jgi:hypothetical protein
MSQYASYNVAVPPSEGDNLSPAERQAQSAALRQPGRVVLQGDTVRIEEPMQVSQSTSPVERASRWRDNLEGPDGRRVDFANMSDTTFVYLPDGDRVPVGVAKRSGFLTTDANGRLVMKGEGQQGNPTNPESPAGAKSQDDSQKPAQQDDQPVRWESPLVDQITSVYAPELGADAMQALVARAVTLGEATLPDHVAERYAQAVSTATPENMREAYRVAYAEAVEHANAMIEATGVKDLNSFIEYAETKQSGDFMDAKYKFAEGDGRALQKMARQYLASHPDAGVSPDTIEAVMAESNDVHGGKLTRKNGVAYVTFDSGQTMPLAAAIRSGFVKVSSNG